MLLKLLVKMIFNSNNFYFFKLYCFSKKILRYLYYNITILIYLFENLITNAIFFLVLYTKILYENIKIKFITLSNFKVL